METLSIYDVIKLKQLEEDAKREKRGEGSKHD